MNDKRARYEMEREMAIKRLEALGLEIVPLEVAAAVLPIIPEWEEYAPKRPKRKKKR